VLKIVQIGAGVLKMRAIKCSSWLCLAFVSQNPVARWRHFMFTLDECRLNSCVQSQTSLTCVKTHAFMRCGDVCMSRGAASFLTNLYVVISYLFCASDLCVCLSCVCYLCMCLLTVLMVFSLNLMYILSTLKFSVSSKVKGKGFPILDTERWARS